jgi:hypothetical protein
LTVFLRSYLCDCGDVIHSEHRTKGRYEERILARARRRGWRRNRARREARGEMPTPAAVAWGLKPVAITLVPLLFLSAFKTFIYNRYPMILSLAF